MTITRQNSFHEQAKSSSVIVCNYKINNSVALKKISFVPQRSYETINYSEKEF
jgi:hypothetical protein